MTFGIVGGNAAHHLVQAGMVVAVVAGGHARRVCVSVRWRWVAASNRDAAPAAASCAVRYAEARACPVARVTAMVVSTPIARATSGRTTSSALVRSERGERHRGSITVGVGTAAYRLDQTIRGDAAPVVSQ